MAKRARGGNRGLTLKAHAKINIGLAVGAPRADGYHEIRSILQEISLADEIRLQEAPDLSLSVDGESGVPAGEANLCFKAAQLLRQATGCSLGASMMLTKRIPIGAGLGGGSSDAAAVLTGLNRLWKLRLPEADLFDLAARLGSDVPFFIRGGCCLVSGRGEILRPMSTFLCDPVVLVSPELPVSTAWAYKNLDNYRLTHYEENVILQRFYVPDRTEWERLDFRGHLRNDFEGVVFSHFPALRAIRDQLKEAGAYFASLSGSGSSLYGVFESPLRARRAVRALQSAGRIFLVKSIVRKQ